MKSFFTKETLKDYALITLGTVMISIGIYFFKFPNNFSVGGISGISVVLAHYLPNLSAGTFLFIISQLLLILGFFEFGRSFGARTAYSSLLMSGLISVLEIVYPMASPLTNEPLLELIFAVAFPAVGSAILFNIQASNGGTEIVAMILKKKTSVNIGQCLLIVDFVITAAAFFAFGPETGLFSILGLIMRTVMVDMVLENIKVHKYFQIITSKPKIISNFIVTELHRGATELQGEGAFSHEDKTIIMTVITRGQAVKLRAFAKKVDPHCFILITNTSEIIGKGFRGGM